MVVNMADTSNAEKISFKLRLRAWWEGYDVNDLQALLAGGANEQDNLPVEEPEKEEEILTVSKQPEEEADSPLEWSEARIDVTQQIWGEGYCGPGGPEQIIAMSKLLGMTSEMSAVVIGAGLGGPCRVLTEEFGTWISGYEAVEMLAVKGMEISTDAGMEEKAAIIHYDPASDEPFGRKFDRGIAKEIFYTIEDKTKLLKRIHGEFKDDALLLVTDYTLGEESALSDPDVQKWMSLEAVTPHLVTADKMAEIITGAGYKVRVNEDISQSYIELIAKSWSQADKIFADLAKQGEDGKKTTEILLHEAEFWSLRSKLLEKGLIRLQRYLASKVKEIR